MKCSEQFLHLNHKFFKKAILAFFLLLLLNFSGYAKIVVELKPFVEVINKNILIKDIADIKSDKNEKTLKNFISTLKITTLKDNIAKIKKEQILKTLQNNYIDVSKINIIGENCIVKLKTKKLEISEIENDIKKFIQQKFGDRIAIKSISIGNKSFTIPFSKTEKKIEIKSSTNSHIYINYFIYNDGKLFKKIPITLKIEKFIMAPFAKRDIPKGKKISINDIYFKKIKIYSKSDILGKDEIIGNIAKRNIKKDSIIKRYFIEPNYLVIKRKSVKIIYKNGPIKIELLGLALENGILGQIIRVKNISSDRIIKCRVVAPFTVEFIR
ncbi:flagellar basal body P-ring formation chaperone FlgA [Nitrosophilus kaiyonis]|uniref:flagellar basal body P-ring formation chaperone FlgA n=1 Tax=Nitrosophilus kaiyonis TaxID=2930200 RepID=UPI0024923A10|nr:flagellar basal body P-ring formation chaperone FlgA [Nitrosophilus kaiyonis]